jgi:hypothetical protein
MNYTKAAFKLENVEYIHEVAYYAVHDATVAISID